MNSTSVALLAYGTNLGNGRDLLTEDEVEDKVRPERIVWTKLAGSLSPEHRPTRESGLDLEGAMSSLFVVANDPRCATQVQQR